MDDRGHPVDSLSALLDDELEAGERNQVESHLALCPGCRALLDDLRRLDAAVGAEVAPPVPTGLDRRIRARLGALHDGGSMDIGRIGRTSPWRSWRAPLPLAAAASLIVAAALWLMRPMPSEAPRSETQRLEAPRSEESESAGTITAPGDEMKKDAGELQRAPSDAMARRSAPPATLREARPAPPPAGNAAPAPTTASAPKQEAAQKSSARAQETDSPREPQATAAADAVEPAPSDDRDRSGLARPETGPKIAGDSLSPSAGVGRPAWPVRIEAPPYEVLLTAENAMVLSAGKWVCQMTIDPADGRGLAALARSAAPTGPGAEPGAAKRSAADAALDMIRERYRSRIEARCGPLPR
jgi:hypothetical protein